jgi:hypothetical protein
VYFAVEGSGNGDAHDILAVPLAGGAPKVLATGQQRTLDIAAHGGDLFWVNQMSAESVVRFPLPDGPAQVVVRDRSEIDEIALDGRHVYWRDHAGHQYYVSRTSRQGGAVEVLVRASSWGRGIAVNDTHVYWVTCETPSTGALWRLPK